jgi:hypothetical protein
LLYAVALVVVLHLPELQVGSAQERTDLWIHLGAFGLLTVLLVFCGWFGEAGSRRNLALSAVVGIAAGAGLEWTQRMQWVRRYFAIDDLMANTTGAGLGIAAALVLLWLWSSDGRRRG